MCIAARYQRSIVEVTMMIQSQLCHNCAPWYRKFINLMTRKVYKLLLLVFYATVLPFILTQLCHSNGFHAETSMLLYRYNIYRLLTVSILIHFMYFKQTIERHLDWVSHWVYEASCGCGFLREMCLFVMNKENNKSWYPNWMKIYCW